MKVSIILSLVLIAAMPPLAEGSLLKGQITTNVNLRKAPSLTGQIITGLEKGEPVVVCERRKDWCLVEISGYGYGYKGWVYGEYVAENRQPAGDTAGPDVETVLQPAAPEAERKPPRPIPAPVAPPPDPEPKEIAPALHAIGPKADSRRPPTFSIKTVPAEPALPTTAASAAAPSTNQETARQTVSAFQGTADSGSAGRITLVLRLSTVVLSCLALVFSYLALQLSRRPDMA